MAREIEWRRGALPPGMLGWRKATEVRETAMNLAVAALTHRQVEPTLARRRHRAAWRPPAHRHRHPVYGDRLVAVGYSKLDGKQLLESWVRLLALAAGHPDHNWTGPHHRPGTARQPGRAAAARAGRRRAARRCCSGLVDLYDEGRRAPLAAAAQDVVRLGLGRALIGQDAQAARRCKKWEIAAAIPGEDADPAHVRVWGEHADLDRPHRLPAAGRAALVAAADAASGGRCDAPDRSTCSAPLPEGPTTTVLEASAGTGKT